MECIHVNQQSLRSSDLKAIVTQALEEVFCVTEEWQSDPQRCRETFSSAPPPAPLSSPE